MTTNLAAKGPPPSPLSPSSMEGIEDALNNIERQLSLPLIDYHQYPMSFRNRVLRIGQIISTTNVVLRQQIGVLLNSEEIEKSILRETLQNMNDKLEEHASVPMEYEEFNESIAELSETAYNDGANIEQLRMALKEALKLHQESQTKISQLHEQVSFYEDYLRNQNESQSAVPSPLTTNEEGQNVQNAGDVPDQMHANDNNSVVSYDLESDKKSVMEQVVKRDFAASQRGSFKSARRPLLVDDSGPQTRIHHQKIDFDDDNILDSFSLRESMRTGYDPHYEELLKRRNKEIEELKEENQKLSQESKNSNLNFEQFKVKYQEMATKYTKMHQLCDKRKEKLSLLTLDNKKLDRQLNHAKAELMKLQDPRKDNQNNKTDYEKLYKSISDIVHQSTNYDGNGEENIVSTVQKVFDEHEKLVLRETEAKSAFKELSDIFSIANQKGGQKGNTDSKADCMTAANLKEVVQTASEMMKNLKQLKEVIQMKKILGTSFATHQYFSDDAELIKSDLEREQILNLLKNELGADISSYSSTFAPDGSSNGDEANSLFSNMKKLVENKEKELNAHIAKRAAQVQALENSLREIISIVDPSINYSPTEENCTPPHLLITSIQQAIEDKKLLIELREKNLKDQVHRVEALKALAEYLKVRPKEDFSDADINEVDLISDLVQKAKKKKDVEDEIMSLLSPELNDLSTDENDDENNSNLSPENRMIRGLKRLREHQKNSDEKVKMISEIIPNDEKSEIPITDRIQQYMETKTKLEKEIEDIKASSNNDEKQRAKRLNCLASIIDSQPDEDTEDIDIIISKITEKIQKNKREEDEMQQQLSTIMQEREKIEKTLQSIKSVLQIEKKGEFNEDQLCFDPSQLEQILAELRSLVAMKEKLAKETKLKETNENSSAKSILMSYRQKNSGKGGENTNIDDSDEESLVEQIKQLCEEREKLEENRREIVKLLGIGGKKGDSMFNGEQMHGSVSDEQLLEQIHNMYNQCNQNHDTSLDELVSLLNIQSNKDDNKNGNETDSEILRKVVAKVKELLEDGIFPLKERSASINPSLEISEEIDMEDPDALRTKLLHYKSKVNGILEERESVIGILQSLTQSIKESQEKSGGEMLPADSIVYQKLIDISNELWTQNSILKNLQGDFTEDLVNSIESLDSRVSKDNSAKKSSANNSMINQQDFIMIDKALAEISSLLDIDNVSDSLSEKTNSIIAKIKKIKKNSKLYNINGFPELEKSFSEISLNEIAKENHLIDDSTDEPREEEDVEESQSSCPPRISRSEQRSGGGASKGLQEIINKKDEILKNHENALKKLAEIVGIDTESVERTKLIQEIVKKVNSLQEEIRKGNHLIEEEDNDGDLYSQLLEKMGTTTSTTTRDQALIDVGKLVDEHNELLSLLLKEEDEENSSASNLSSKRNYKIPMLDIPTSSCANVGTESQIICAVKRLLNHQTSELTSPRSPHSPRSSRASSLNLDPADKDQLILELRDKIVELESKNDGIVEERKYLTEMLKSVTEKFQPVSSPKSTGESYIYEKLSAISKDLAEQQQILKLIQNTRKKSPNDNSQIEELTSRLSSANNTISTLKNEKDSILKIISDKDSDEIPTKTGGGSLEPLSKQLEVLNSSITKNIANILNIARDKFGPPRDKNGDYDEGEEGENFDIIPDISPVKSRKSSNENVSKNREIIIILSKIEELNKIINNVSDHNTKMITEYPSLLQESKEDEVDTIEEIPKLKSLLKGTSKAIQKLTEEKEKIMKSLSTNSNNFYNNIHFDDDGSVYDEDGFHNNLMENLDSLDSQMSAQNAEISDALVEDEPLSPLPQLAQIPRQPSSPVGSGKIRHSPVNSVIDHLRSQMNLLAQTNIEKDQTIEKLRSQIEDLTTNSEPTIDELRKQISTSNAIIQQLREERDLILHTLTPEELQEKASKAKSTELINKLSDLDLQISNQNAAIGDAIHTDSLGDYSSPNSPLSSPSGKTPRTRNREQLINAINELTKKLKELTQENVEKDLRISDLEDQLADQFDNKDIKDDKKDITEDNKDSKDDNLKSSQLSRYWQNEREQIAELLDIYKENEGGESGNNDPQYLSNAVKQLKDRIIELTNERESVILSLYPDGSIKDVDDLSVEVDKLKAQLKLIQIIDQRSKTYEEKLQKASKELDSIHSIINSENSSSLSIVKQVELMKNQLEAKAAENMQLKSLVEQSNTQLNILSAERVDIVKALYPHNSDSNDSDHSAGSISPIQRQSSSRSTFKLDQSPILGAIYQLKSQVEELQEINNEKDVKVGNLQEQITIVEDKSPDKDKLKKLISELNAEQEKLSQLESKNHILSKKVSNLENERNCIVKTIKNIENSEFPPSSPSRAENRFEFELNDINPTVSPIVKHITEFYQKMKNNKNGEIEIQTRDIKLNLEEEGESENIQTIHKLKASISSLLSEVSQKANSLVQQIKQLKSQNGQNSPVLLQIEQSAQEITAIAQENGTLSKLSIESNFENNGIDYKLTEEINKAQLEIYEINNDMNSDMTNEGKRGNDDNESIEKLQLKIMHLTNARNSITELLKEVSDRANSLIKQVTELKAQQKQQQKPSSQRNPNAKSLNDIEALAKTLLSQQNSHSNLGTELSNARQKIDELTKELEMSEKKLEKLRKILASKNIKIDISNDDNNNGKGKDKKYEHQNRLQDSSSLDNNNNSYNNNNNDDDSVPNSPQVSNKKTKDNSSSNQLVPSNNQNKDNKNEFQQLISSHVMQLDSELAESEPITIESLKNLSEEESKEIILKLQKQVEALQKARASMSELFAEVSRRASLLVQQMAELKAKPRKVFVNNGNVEKLESAINIIASKQSTVQNALIDSNRDSKHISPFIEKIHELEEKLLLSETKVKELTEEKHIALSGNDQDSSISNLVQIIAAATKECDKTSRLPNTNEANEKRNKNKQPIILATTKEEAASTSPPASPSSHYTSSKSTINELDSDAVQLKLQKLNQARESLEKLFNQVSQKAADLVESISSMKTHSLDSSDIKELENSAISLKTSLNINQNCIKLSTKNAEFQSRIHDLEKQLDDTKKQIMFQQKDLIMKQETKDFVSNDLEKENEPVLNNEEVNDSFLENEIKTVKKENKELKRQLNDINSIVHGDIDNVQTKTSLTKSILQLFNIAHEPMTEIARIDILKSQLESLNEEKNTIKDIISGKIKTVSSNKETPLVKQLLSKLNSTTSISTKACLPQNNKGNKNILATIESENSRNIHVLSGQETEHPPIEAVINGEEIDDVSDSTLVQQIAALVNSKSPEQAYSQNKDFGARSKQKNQLLKTKLAESANRIGELTQINEEQKKEIDRVSLILDGKEIVDTNNSSLIKKLKSTLQSLANDSKDVLVKQINTLKNELASANVNTLKEKLAISQAQIGELKGHLERLSQEHESLEAVITGNAPTIHTPLIEQVQAIIQNAENPNSIIISALEVNDIEGAALSNSSLVQQINEMKEVDNLSGSNMSSQFFSQQFEHIKSELEQTKRQLYQLNEERSTISSILDGDFSSSSLSHSTSDDNDNSNDDDTSDIIPALLANANDILEGIDNCFGKPSSSSHHPSNKFGKNKNNNNENNKKKKNKKKKKSTSELVEKVKSFASTASNNEEVERLKKRLAEAQELIAVYAHQFSKIEKFIKLTPIGSIPDRAKAIAAEINIFMRHEKENKQKLHEMKKQIQQLLSQLAQKQRQHQQNTINTD